MAGYSDSNLLRIGALTFLLSETVAWPQDGPLRCYQHFITNTRPSDPPHDRIAVTLTKGLPDISASILTDSGDGIQWAREENTSIVMKVLPHLSPKPIWVIRIRLDEPTAEVFFSEFFLSRETLVAGWPVAALHYPLDQHLAMHFLATRSGALLHSAGICHNGKGLICSGVSGAGKTTISRLLQKHGAFEILSDDRIIVRCGQEAPFNMHGTPWSGEGRYATAGMAKLRAIFFLRQDTCVKAVPLSPADTVNRLLPVCSVPWFSEELMTLTMRTLEKVVTETVAFDLHFTKSDETALAVAELMRDIA